ncbi:MAG: hypothetical protein Q8Q47_06720 [Ignavibacteriaceae bacterium]|nr:hypothetical protein [Ignavibacteriaceae bacterium]
MKNIYIIILIIVASLSFLFISCGDDKKEGAISEGQEDIAYNPEKDGDIQAFNIERRKKLAVNRFPCDTIDVMEYILKNYPEGSYLVELDKPDTYTVPRNALLYRKERDTSYIYSMVIKSKADERVVELKNVVGYDQSFFNLDSTALGMAYFYLTILRCNAGNLETVWESLVPDNSGFNYMVLETWKAKKIPYMRVNFHYAIGIGHIDYNFFFINGLNEEPHLLMTYKTINSLREMIDANNDNYPDYIEHLYVDTGSEVKSVDTVTFIWRDSLYVNTRNPKQTRPF